MGRKYFDDGSTYDLKFGYRNAEKVAKDEENGVDTSLKMTPQERANLWQGLIALLVILAIASISFTTYKVIQAKQAHVEAQKAYANDIHAISSELNRTLNGAKIIKIKGDEMLISVMTGNGNSGVIKCEIEKAKTEDGRHAYLFCDQGSLATLDVKLSG